MAAVEDGIPAGTALSGAYEAPDEDWLLEWLADVEDEIGARLQAEAGVRLPWASLVPGTDVGHVLAGWLRSGCLPDLGSITGR